MAYLSGTYRGASNRLGGKHAILMPARRAGWVVAQFDDTDLSEAFGWHPFPEGEFEMDAPINCNRGDAS